MNIRGVASVLAVGAAMLLSGNAYAQQSPFGSFNIKGLIRNETSISTSNHNEYNGSCGLAQGCKNRRDLNILAMRAEANVYWRYSPDLTGYGKLRAWTDWVNKVDDAYPNSLDMMQGQRGTGGQMLSKAGDQWIVDIPQLYIDWRPGPFWIRVGKQQISWAEALLLSTVDIIDGLDLRRHFFLDVLGEEIADERIANNGIRFGIPLPWISSGWELEGYFTDFHPSIFPNTCAPYSPFACRIAGLGGESNQLRLRDTRLHNVRNNWNYGGRIHGPIGEFEVMLGYISKPSSGGIFIPTANPLVLSRRFPREKTVVWGVNYLYMSESGGSFLDGTVVRWDGGVTFDKSVATNAGVRKKTEISTAIQMEKQIRWSLSQPSMFAFAQPIWFRNQTGPYSGAYLRDKGRHHFFYSAIGFNQLIGNGSLRYDFVTAHDWAGGELTQTGFLWKPSGKYQVDVYYSDFRGDAQSEFGESTMGHWDELFFRLTRYF